MFAFCFAENVPNLLSNSRPDVVESSMTVLQGNQQRRISTRALINNLGTEAVEAAPPASISNSLHSCNHEEGISLLTSGK